MILAIDQGTTGTTVILFNEQGEVLGRGYREFEQHFPQPGWVEHDPNDLWQSTLQATAEALEQSKLPASAISGIGITNQRETCVVWDRATGKPVYNAIVWQCRRSAGICDELIAANKGPWLLERTGLVLDAYFTGSKLKWLFDQQPQLRQRAQRGELCFGTVDSWLIWNLTAGQSHVTDHTNACRTLLYNIDSRSWDDELLACFDVDKSLLPRIVPSSGFIAAADPGAFLGISAPICGIAGDQQAALFGQNCTREGMIKNTYGTGCFMLMYAGSERPEASNGLLCTVACDANGQPAYALEGSVFVGGAVVQWLRDQLGIIQSAAETQALAEGLADNQGVYIVPAFTGLGAPHWDMAARGTIVGLTRGSGRQALVRAALESIAYQCHDLAQLMSQQANTDIDCIRVDGGACANDFLMQFQADISAALILRPRIIESTALGAALLAGIGCGFWQPDQLPPQFCAEDKRFTPQMAETRRQQLLAGWHTAVRQTLSA